MRCGECLPCRGLPCGWDPELLKGTWVGRSSFYRTLAYVLGDSISGALCMRIDIVMLCVKPIEAIIMLDLDRTTTHQAILALVRAEDEERARTARASSR